ncbi:4Fe-4S dicluster domain-containing protein [Janibacter sp. GXQ6167]|uniref:4Fe-4S dicluster domain-containing protein n=1 Tax=Janibacter sp. GXQ6167 TaxID=3240791 RepID=UPI003523B077
MSWLTRQLSGPSEDVAADAGWSTPPSRKGFFTDTSICIGCKACEVACKEWNAIPLDGLKLTGNSYDNTGDLGGSTWRHVAFVEQGRDRIEAARASGARLVELGMPTVGPPASPARAGTPAGYGTLPAPQESTDLRDLLAANPATMTDAATTVDGTPMVGPLPEFRWLMASDVCKHCTHAGCLDVCPTGALFRTEFGTVVVQADVCNGCGYCVGACPFGVIERRTGQGSHFRGQPEDEHVPNIGVAQKCTLCYDRLGHDQMPACAQTCPTTSIRFGDHDDMVDAAKERVAQLHDQGFTEARLYGANELDGVGGTGSVFLLLDEPEVYGLPPDPVVATTHLPDMFRKAGIAALAMIGAAAVSFIGGRS